MPAQSRYSLSDWNAMLQGCVVRYANDVVYVNEVRSDGDLFVISGEIFTDGSSRRGLPISIPFSENDMGAFDYSRPSGRLVRCGLDTYMVRPLVRRSRRKGIFQEDYEAINLSTSRRTTVGGVNTDHRRKIYTALYGLATTAATGVSRDGSLAIISTGANLPASPVFNNSNSELQESAYRFLGVLGAALGRSSVVVETTTTLDSNTINSLEQLFNLSPATLSLFWFEARIGVVQGTTIIINGSADLLAPAVRNAFPGHEVEINAAA